jgi:16S rRNA processing protein RimM
MWTSADADQRRVQDALTPSAMQVVIGRIGRPHGVLGLVTVQVHTDDPELRFAPGATLLTDPPGRGPLVVVESRAHSGGPCSSPR